MSEIDRISLLPDCLIHQILSFLKTKESIRTTVLSKRWIHVWKSIPRLDLNASDFKQVETFMNFTNSIFHHKLFPNPEKLDTFNLTWPDFDNGSQSMLKMWISNLISLKPRMVNINISNGMSSVLCLFNCTNLESLVFRTNLNGAWKSINLKAINLPNLRRLNLGWLELKDEFIHRLFLGCPILEELLLQNVVFDVTERIESSTLKKFVICNSEFGKNSILRFVICNSEFGENSILRICMPNLEYLSCEVRLGGFLFGNLPKLEYASLNVMQKKYYEKGKVLSLRSLSNVKTLQLSGSFFEEILEMETLDLPVFEKLESLKIGVLVLDKDLEPLVSIMTNAPKLKELTLRKISMLRANRVCVLRNK